MYYYETDNKTGKRAGLIAAVAYIAVWVVLFLVVSFKMADKQLGQGIMMDFGNTENAAGQNDPGLNEVTPQPERRQEAQAAPETEPEEVLTQDTPEAPEIAKAAPERPKRPAAEETKKSETKRTDTTVVEKPRVADPRLNFPGKTEGSTSTSQGTTEGAGNQGKAEGMPGGNPEGTGMGGDGNSFDLTGRSVMGRLPVPEYSANVGGRVIVEITVDATGKVVNTQFRAKGSTTTNAELINSAIRAARSSRFSTIKGDGMQVGTITYNFKLN